MRAAIFRNGDLVVDDIKDPTPSDGQVLVKSLCCGICGSDLHAAKHTPEFVNRSRRSGNRWAMEAFLIARSDAYGLLPPSGDEGAYALPPEYAEQAARDVALQLSRAGVRLAMVLNQALAAARN